MSNISEKPIGSVGFGMLGLTKPWAPVEYSAAVKVMKTALEQGASFWNGGIHYGTPTANSLHLIKHYFEQYPEDVDKVCLSIKGAYDINSGPEGSPEGIRASVDYAIGVLGGVKTINVFELARVDPRVPVEASIQALADLVKEGKIGGIGLSEVSAATISKAHAVHPIAAVEIELSLFTTEPLQNGIVDTCHDLGIPVIAYSPMSRGWLKGELRKPEDLSADDFRRLLPRFQPNVFDQNFKLVEAVEAIAKRKGVTTAQVAIGWVCQQGAIPIPGSTKVDRVVENSHPAAITGEGLLRFRRS